MSSPITKKYFRLKPKKKTKKTRKNIPPLLLNTIPEEVEKIEESDVVDDTKTVRDFTNSDNDKMFSDVGDNITPVIDSDDDDTILDETPQNYEEQTYQEYTDDFETSEFFIPVVKINKANKHILYRLLKNEYNKEDINGKIGPYGSKNERDEKFEILFGTDLFFKKGKDWMKQKYIGDKPKKTDDIKNTSWLAAVKQRSTLMDPTESSAAPAAGGKTKRRRRQRKSKRKIVFSIFSFPFACSKEDFRKTKKSQRKNRKTRRK